jgi:DNA-binding NarL/FixJ family response regulator
VPPVRIALIEDSAPFSRALQRFFDRPGSGVRCLAVYTSAEEALREIPRSEPEVALVDMNLPGASGIECVARLKTIAPSVLCLVLTIFEDAPMIFEALKAGACGYLLKRTSPAKIADAIVQVRAGGSPMSLPVARQVVSFFHARPPSEDLSVLTEREHDVLDRLAAGERYQEIADRLGVSIHTIRAHVRKVYEKLHVHSRTEAVLKFLGKPR